LSQIDSHGDKQKVSKITVIEHRCPDLAGKDTTNVMGAWRKSNPAEGVDIVDYIERNE
jgi:hypothetical protein